jgi:hypothetical protein
LAKPFKRYETRGDVMKKEIQIQVQTPRGLWSMQLPENAPVRPEYDPHSKVEQVIIDSRRVFGFVENDSKYTLFFDRQELLPQRPLVSYGIKDNDLLLLSVQGGNA